MSHDAPQHAPRGAVNAVQHEAHAPRRHTRRHAWRWPIVVAVPTCVLFAAAGWRWWETHRLLRAVPHPALQSADTRVAAAIEQALSLVRSHPRSAEAWGQAGMILHAHEYTDEALTCYRMASRWAPHEPQWPYLAAMLVRHRDPAEARRLLQRAVDAEPGEPLFRIRLAELDAEAGRWENANRHVDAALRLQPDAPHALWLKARIAMKLGRWADAEELLQRAAERLPHHALIVADLRQVRFRLHRRPPDPGDAELVTPRDALPASAQAAVPQPAIPAGAGSARTGAASALADWPDRFLEQLAQYRFDPHWQAYRAAELARFGRLDAAIRTMQRVVQEAPDEPLFAGALVRLLVRAKRLAEAERVVDEARRKHPEDFELLRLAATVRLLQGDAAAAEALLRRAIDRKPDNAAVRYDRALALLAMKRRDEALQELEAAVRVDPAFFDAWFALANERLADGEIEAARRCLENALRLRPDDARVLRLQRRIQRP